MRITINGRLHELDDRLGEETLLWVLREHLGLVGAKYGCGVGTCGACTIHVNGEAIQSCQLSLADAAGASVTTIEGLAATATTNSTSGLHPVQEAWVAESVPQCGYCQAGQIMSAAALLAANGAPSDADIDSAMATNLCRCGTYGRIRKAIHRAALARGA